MPSASIEIEFELPEAKFDGIDSFGPGPSDIVHDLDTVEGLAVSESTLHTRVREDGSEVSVVDATIEIGEALGDMRAAARKFLDGLLGVFRSDRVPARFRPKNGDWIDISNMPREMTEGDWDTELLDAVAAAIAGP